MSTRHEHRGHNSAGRGHSHRSERIRNTTAHAPPGGGRFTGLNTQLPILDYGSTKHNKPIAFLITMGEHCSVTYRKSIAFAVGSTPPEYGIERDAPELANTLPVAPEKIGTLPATPAPALDTTLSAVRAYVGPMIEPLMFKSLKRAAVVPRSQVLAPLARILTTLVSPRSGVRRVVTIDKCTTGPNRVSRAHRKTVISRDV